MSDDERKDNQWLAEQVSIEPERHVGLAYIPAWDPALCVKEVEWAREAGVMAYLLKPLRPAELAPALDLAVARFREARDLKQSLEDRKVIERAKGRLMERHALTEEQAFQRLRRAAMDNRRPMVEIARAVLVSDTVTSGTPTSP